jgi:hypothetical protein
MMCAQAKQWLLQAELPRELKDAPADVAAHLRDCAECQRLVEQLQVIEREWREQPLPASAAEAREDFLRIHGDEAPRPSEVRRRFVAPRWLVAACLIVAVGVTGWFMAQPQKAHADSDVIDRLIDWNLQLSDAGEAERRELFAGQVEFLRADSAKLPDEDRAFAESLIRNGEFLASNPEPLETADRFAVLADQLVERLDHAAARNDPKASAKLARQYMHVANRGVKPKLERAARQAAADEARQRRLDKIAQREANQFAKLARMQERLEKMHDAAPPASKKELRKLLDESKPKPKKNPNKHPQL